MKQCNWYSGPPPHVGWWCTYKEGRFTRWRWWDGYKWSLFAIPSDPRIIAGEWAKTEALHQNQKWNNYWPENARVPRIDPRRTEVKDKL